MADDSELTSPLLPPISAQPAKGSYSVKRAKVATMIVPMLYFAGVVPISSLLPQYLIHRFTLEAGHVKDNFSVKHNPCHPDLNHSSHAEADAIQSKASDISLYLSLASGIPSFFGCLLLGGFADIYGRRPLLLLAIFTGFMKMLSIALTIKFDLPLWVLYSVYVLDGLSGSWTIMYVALLAAIADVNRDKKERLLWIAVLNCCTSVMSSIMILVGGYLIGALGYFPASLLSVGTTAASFTFTWFFLPETGVLPQTKSLNAIANVRRTVRFFILDGSTRKKLTFWSCLILFMFTIMPGMTTATLDTLYQVHRPFCWDPFYVGVYHASRLGGQYLAGAFILKFIQKCVKGEYLAMAGLLTQGGAYVLEAFVTKSWQFALVPVIGVFGSTSISVVRGCISVLAPSVDQAAVFSSVAVMEVVCSIIASTGVMRVYSLTVGTFAGASYLLSGALSFAAFFIFIIFLLIRQDHYEVYSKIETSINIVPEDGHQEQE